MIDITSYVNGYSPVGDIIVMAVIIVMAILIRVTYIRQSSEFKMFKVILLCTLIAAISNLVFRQNMGKLGDYPVFLLYIEKYITHFSVLFALALYLIYIKNQMKLPESTGRMIDFISIAVFTVFASVDLLGMMFGFGFSIIDYENIQPGQYIPACGYLLFAFLILCILIRFGKHMYRPVVIALYASIFMSFVITCIQQKHDQKSFTISTLIFPAIAIMYLMHSNPYNLETGSLHADSLIENIENALKKKDDLLIIFLHITEGDRKGYKFPKEMRDTIREVSTYMFKGAKLFQVAEGKIALSVRLAINSDYSKGIDNIISTFNEQYAIYKKDYKMVIIRTMDELDKADDYIQMIDYVENRMLQNEIHYVNDEDVERYKSHKYIVEQLADINSRKDLRDPRVLVYCQPVYNIETGKFDTAEALMRLRLEKIGMVFPDRFIPIAEKHHYIHILSLIIFSKTCNEIRRQLDDGYFIKRISVNFSILDFKEKDFCENITKIVRDAGIPFDKVAIEITESQNEKDFMALKEKLFELRDSGITFYLDDFGTGYSNMERIMELPFDIIKFDRSLVIASGSDNKSKTMVTHMAHMFNDMKYDVLYEGVEDDNDQNRCKEMYARYLQGYKYSKPIPIEQLSEFLERENFE
ncbi:EAL domain-containing protein [Butyrivibrio sp. AE2005]|uniref:EAL domain-containing protein n=1 Tax=Butyrivibrio sp. AE2005 TaxID=1496722 RepID=UPI00047EB7B4|nr:EAL domain-containing protein [Butyrivibrio sp. AE2005]